MAIGILGGGLTALTLASTLKAHCQVNEEISQRIRARREAAKDFSVATADSGEGTITRRQ